MIEGRVDDVGLRDVVDVDPPSVDVLTVGRVDVVG